MSAPTADIFLSYASEDREKAEPLVGVLAGRGWSVWWDKKIPPGTDYESFIKERLDAARCVIVLWSKHSTASRWVRAEANSAADRGVLVPVSINGAEVPIGLSTIQVARLADWDGRAPHAELDRLLGAVAERLGAPSAEPEEPPRQRPTWKHWLVAGAVVVHVAAGLALLFARVSSTQVRLELEVVEVGLASAALQPLITDQMGVDMLGVSGVATIDVPQAPGPGSESYGGSSLLKAEPTGAIQLEPFSVAAGARLALRRMDVPGTYRLVVEGAGFEFGASVEGPVQLVVPQVLNERRNFVPARKVAFHSDAGLVDLDFRLAAGRPSTLSPRLAANDLRLSRREYHDGEWVMVSTILTGRLFYVTLDKQGPGFSEGEALRFTQTEGVAQGLQPAGDHVALTFDGSVRGMSMGSGDLQKNLMPTWLDWLLAHRSLSLLAKLYLGLLALTAAAARWWKDIVAWARRP